MRTHRFLTGLLGLVLIAATPITLTVSATAASGGAATATAATTATAPTAERAKPRRELNDRSVQRRGNWYIVGRLTPEGGRKLVEFKRKLGAKAPWRVWKRVRTDAQGHFRVLVQFPRGTRATWYYKGVVAGGQKYAVSRTDKIYTACRRRTC